MQDRRVSSYWHLVTYLRESKPQVYQRQKDQEGARMEEVTPLKHPNVHTRNELRRSRSFATGAFVISLVTLLIQLFAFGAQNESLITQGAELETQKKELAVQQQALENAERQFKESGAILTASLALWRDGPPVPRPQLPGQSEPGTEPVTTLMGRVDEDVLLGKGSVRMTSAHFEGSPRFYLELTVSNEGRSGGGVDRIGGTSNFPTDSCTTASCWDFAFEESQEVSCVDDLGREGGCTFPIGVLNTESQRFRYDVTKFLNENQFGCEEEGSLSLVAFGWGTEYLGPQLDIVDARQCPDRGQARQ